jgi:CSLREA domain-containing protein
MATRRIRLTLLVIGGVIGITLLTACIPLAQTFTVTSTADGVDAVVGDGICATPAGDCTLRAAIMEANADPDLEVILFASDDYTLSLPGSEEDGAATGDLDVHTSLRIEGRGATVDGASLDRVFDLHDGTVELHGVTITGGATAGDGGGIRNNADGLSLWESAIRMNRATGHGGAILNGTHAGLVNVSLLDNTAGGLGGGLANDTGADAVLGSSTIAGNRAAAGGGLATTSPGGTGSIRVFGSVVVENGADPLGAPADCAIASGGAATIASLGGNFESGQSCGFTAARDGNGEALLGPVLDPADAAPHRRPLPGSPLIDAMAAGPDCLPHDQRSVTRPQGAGCDIGAVEVTPAELAPLSLIVDTASDTTDTAPGDGVCTDAAGACSLRAAVQETNAFPTADRITIATGVDPRLSLAGRDENSSATGDLDIRGELTLDGNGAVADADRVDRVFHVLSTATIRDLTIRGGGSAINGAGVRNQGGQLRLERVTLTDNEGATGGAVRNDNGGVLHVVNSTISGNSSTGNGSAIYAASGETDVVLTTITANSTGSGGAIRGDGVFRIAGAAIGDQLAGEDCAGSITTLGHNVVTTPTGCAPPVTGDTSVTSLWLDPLASNGGPTPTHLPRSNSPLRDHLAPGTEVLCDGTLATDQRGVARPVDSDSDGVAACDVGGVEGETVVEFIGVPAALARNGQPVTLQARPAGGTFAGPGVHGDVLDPSVGGTGDRTISYSVDGRTVTAVVDVFPVSLTYVVSSGQGDYDRYIFTGTPAGGTYTVVGDLRPLPGNTLDEKRCGYDITVRYSGTYKGAPYAIEGTIDRPVCRKE